MKARKKPKTSRANVKARPKARSKPKNASPKLAIVPIERPAVTPTTPTPNAPPIRKKRAERFVARVENRGQRVVEVYETDTGKSVWKGVMGEGVLADMKGRSPVWFTARWKTDELLTIGDEVEHDPHDRW